MELTEKRKKNSIVGGIDPLTLIATIVFGISFTLTPYIIHTYTLYFSLQVMVAFIPLASFIFFLLRFNHSVNVLDELGKRIHKESLLYALTLVIIFEMVEYTMKLAFPHWEGVNHIPTGIGWLPLWYIIAGAIVNKRYQ